MRSDASLYVRSGFGTRLGMGLGRGTKLQIQGKIRNSKDFCNILCSIQEWVQVDWEWDLEEALNYRFKARI